MSCSSAGIPARTYRLARLLAWYPTSTHLRLPGSEPQRKRESLHLARPRRRHRRTLFAQRQVPQHSRSSRSQPHQPLRQSPSRSARGRQSSVLPLQLRRRKRAHVLLEPLRLLLSLRKLLRDAIRVLVDLRQTFLDEQQRNILRPKEHLADESSRLVRGLNEHFDVLLHALARHELGSFDSERL